MVLGSGGSYETGWKPRLFNPTALIAVKTPQSFGRSECNMIKAP